MKTADQLIQEQREQFEKAAVVKFALWRVAGNSNNDNGVSATRESLCWRLDDGNYGVAALNAAWWGWRAHAMLGSPQTDAPERPAPPPGRVIRESDQG